jgi:hypothetical protein
LPGLQVRTSHGSVAKPQVTANLVPEFRQGSIVLKGQSLFHAADYIVLALTYIVQRCIVS